MLKKEKKKETNKQTSHGVNIYHQTLLECRMNFSCNIVESLVGFPRLTYHHFKLKPYFGFLNIPPKQLLSAWSQTQSHSSLFLSLHPSCSPTHKCYLPTIQSISEIYLSLSSPTISPTGHPLDQTLCSALHMQRSLRHLVIGLQFWVMHLHQSKS